MAICCQPNDSGIIFLSPPTSAPNRYVLWRKLEDHGRGFIEWRKACMITPDARIPTPYLVTHTAQNK